LAIGRFEVQKRTLNREKAEVMHDIEPYYKWRDMYTAESDEHSPFYKREYSEFHFPNAVYNYCIHPQWDDIGSPTIYLKLLFVDYEVKFSIIEFIGEWNDCIHNDIMILKREVLDWLMKKGITQFILVGENILNFHSDGDEYYEEWFQELMDEDGWIAALNFREHVLQEMRDYNLDLYVNFGGELDDLSWRTMNPRALYHNVKQILSKRLDPRSEV